MSKKDRQLDALIASMNAQIASMKDPAANPAQQFLTNSAIEGANWMKGGDYRALPKGMFFDFKGPQEQIDQYRKTSNVGQTGTFALGTGDNAGATNAMGLQKQYLNDKFARDAAQNYQDNVARAGSNIQAGLGQASGYKSGQDAAIINAMQGMVPAIGQMKQGGGFLSGLLGAAGGIMQGLGKSGLGI